MENIANQPNQTLTPFQIQILELTSRVKSAEEMKEIRQMLAVYFAKKVEEEIDKLWDEGKINDEVIEGWKYEHMRTPYRQ